MQDYDKRGHEYIRHDAVRPLFIIFIVPDQYNSTAKSSVADPWHFGVDPDPNPRIHASE